MNFCSLNSRHQLQQDRAQGGLVELPMAFFGDSTYSKSKFTGRDSHVMPLSFNLSHSDTVQQKVCLLCDDGRDNGFMSFFL